MGGYSTIHCNYEKRNRESHVKQYSEPKNKFERALSDKKKQSLAGYRVALLNGGFLSKQRYLASSGKITLTVKAIAKNES